MKFSVLIPVYEKEKEENLKECLYSVVNQTLKPDEIVIIKDGLLPKKLDEVIDDIKNKNKNLSIVTHQINKNIGTGMALNIGLKLCRNEYIARIDSDDISLKNRFEKQIKYLDLHNEVDILGGNIEEYDENMNTLISVRNVPKEDFEIKKLMKRRCPFNHSTVIYKKDKIIEVGGYPNKRIMEDYDLWIRCMNKGFKMYNLPDILTKNRTGNNMYKKRGGFKYLKSIYEIENMLYNYHIINFIQKWIFIISKSIVALLPTQFRKKIYIKFLRKNNYE